MPSHMAKLGQKRNTTIEFLPHKLQSPWKKSTSSNRTKEMLLTANSSFSQFNLKMEESFMKSGEVNGMLDKTKPVYFSTLQNQYKQVMRQTFQGSSTSRTKQPTQ